MACMLAFEQNERRNIVGVFRSEQNAVNFLENIPFLQKIEDEYGIVYHIPFKSLPDSYPVYYNGWQYVLSRFSYSSCEFDGDIEAVLTPLCELDAAPPKGGAYVEGATAVDAYLYPNDEVLSAIEKRETFYREAELYYGKQGRKIGRGGLGSEDGEYITVSEPGDPTDMYLTILLEPQVIQEWEKAGSYEAWLKQHRPD